MIREMWSYGAFGKSMLLFMATIILVCAGTPICLALGGLNIDYSEGDRTGVVFKISKKGLIWKTWEGELSLQLTTRGSEGQLVNQIFRFSTTSDEVAQALKDAAASGSQVTLTYREYLLRGWKYGSTGYDIQSVTGAR